MYVFYKYVVHNILNKLTNIFALIVLTTFITCCSNSVESNLLGIKMNLEKDWGIKDYESHVEIGPKSKRGSPFDYIQIRKIEDSTQIFSNLDEMKDKFNKNERFDSEKIVYEHISDKSFGLVWNPSYNEFGLNLTYSIQLKIGRIYFQANPGMVAYASKDYDLKKIKSFIQIIETIEENK